jgi:hypothetical protein
MTDKDLGVIMALIERFQTQRLPRALALKEKVDRGGLLDDNDMAFLQHVQEDAQYVTPLVSKHPEWQPFVTRAAGLYKEITDKALANETAASTRKPQ